MSPNDSACSSCSSCDRRRRSTWLSVGLQALQFVVIVLRLWHEM